MADLQIYIKNLERSSFSRQQAEGQVQTIMNIIQSECATKEDLSVAFKKLDKKMMVGALIIFCHFTFMLNWLSKDLADVKKELKSDISGVRTDISGVKADISGIKTDIVDIKSDIVGIKSELSGLKTDIGDLKKVVFEIREEVRKGP